MLLNIRLRIHDYGVGCGRDKLILRHFLNACHGALSVEDFEMLNDFMPFPYPLGWVVWWLECIGAFLRYLLKDDATRALLAHWCPCFFLGSSTFNVQRSTRA